MRSLYERALRERELPRGKTLHVKIGGWGGIRNIPKKQLQAFENDLKAMRAQGFSRRDQVVQVAKRDFAELEKVVQKHKLQIKYVEAAKRAISGIGN